MQLISAGAAALVASIRLQMGGLDVLHKLFHFIQAIFMS